MSSSKRTVLITGCSDDGLGAALAIAFHEAGLHVYATARNPNKLKQVQSRGIETMILDVLDENSIKENVSRVEAKGGLDILLNNAGAGYSMPFSDLDLKEAKKLFDLNVWSYLSVTQAFLPLLIKSRGMIVNNSSIAAVCTVPFQSTYNASKAAMTSFSNHQRLELEPFGVRVVDLKTGAVATNFFANMDSRSGLKLPANSIYDPARETVEKTLSGEDLMKSAIPSSVWARDVVKDLLKTSPPSSVWRGASALMVWLGTMAPAGWVDGMVKKMIGLDIITEKVAR